MVDYFRKAGLDPIGIYIHGGEKVTQEGSTFRVPKRDLIGGLQVLYQNSRLRVSRKLKLTNIFTAELLNFKLKFDPATAHDSYSAWREQDHDDLLLAAAMAVWYGERPEPPTYDIVAGGPSVMGGLFQMDEW